MSAESSSSQKRVAQRRVLPARAAHARPNPRFATEAEPTQQQGSPELTDLTVINPPSPKPPPLAPNKRRAGPLMSSPRVPSPPVLPAMPSLRTELDAAAKDASNLAKEATKLFGSIASRIDEVSTTDPPADGKMFKALKALKEDLSEVVKRHVRAYVAGCDAASFRTAQSLPESSRRSSSSLNGSTSAGATPPSGRSSAEPDSRPLRPAGPTSYAAAASCPAPPTPTPKRPTAPPVLRKTPAVDNRLFIRVPDSNPLKQGDAYALHRLLKSSLGALGPSLHETQKTSTGFALRPSPTSSTPALETAVKSHCSLVLEGTTLERSTRWTSYRACNIPRKIGLFHENLGLHQTPVTSEMLIAEVFELTGLKPVAVSPTPASLSSPADFTTSWFINFPGDHPALLPTRLCLFGAMATIKFLPPRNRTTQCDRCFLWHNSRSCARAPKCRRCGSTEHLEADHSNRCATPSPHECPPRCLHCHGPHPADAITCPLRPNPKSARKTKSQLTEIRAAGAAARLRIVGEQCRQVPSPGTPTPSPRASRCLPHGEAALAALDVLMADAVPQATASMRRGPSETPRNPASRLASLAGEEDTNSRPHTPNA